MKNNKRHISHSSGKLRPWSKLRCKLENLFDPDLDLQIHCVAYPMNSRHGGTKLVRYWFVMNNEIIWDYPKDFSTEAVTELSDGSEVMLSECYPYGGFQCDFSAIFDDYMNTPKEELINKAFQNDRCGLTDILKAADRRIGKWRLVELQSTVKNRAALKILEIRIGISQKVL
jgi:hypothetical protein